MYISARLPLWRSGAKQLLKYLRLMLPDFPHLKKKIHTRILWGAQHVARAKTGVLSEISHNRIHEGNRHILIREDGSVDEMEMRKLSATREFDYSEAKDKRLKELFNDMVDVISEIAEKQMFHLIEEVEEATRKTGNIVEAEGEPLGIEAIFKSLETVYIEFDSAGNARMPTMLIHPSWVEEIEDLERQFQEDPDLQRRFSEIMERKKDEWRSREANRKLVG